MAFGEDGRYYAEADFKGKEGKAAREKFDRLAEEAAAAEAKSNEAVSQDRPAAPSQGGVTIAETQKKGQDSPGSKK